MGEGGLNPGNKKNKDLKNWLHCNRRRPRHSSIKCSSEFKLPLHVTKKITQKRPKRNSVEQRRKCLNFTVKIRAKMYSKKSSFYSKNQN